MTSRESILKPIGDVRMWVDPCGVAMLKSVTSSGDPVELNEEELAEVIAALQITLERVRSGDVG